jgi:hypothetical protein
MPSLTPAPKAIIGNTIYLRKFDGLKIIFTANQAPEFPEAI